ncbi:phosphopantetheine-binding protein [Streptomyces sp. NPDC045470]|uniref:phosphopantetheine-binding protein n=1 Tax=Streptomyces sp. NPDC045470 TaxID=3155469 RepID=UPI00340004D1
MSDDQLTSTIDTTEVLLDVWQKQFRDQEVGLEDDFFELGGHSLLAARVISQVRAALGKRVRFKDITECRTIARLAARIDEGR